MVEKFDATTAERLTAFHDRPNSVFPDGTILAFSGGDLQLRSDEWFQADAVVRIFQCFKDSRPFDTEVRWRVAPLFPSPRRVRQHPATSCRSRQQAKSASKSRSRPVSIWSGVLLQAQPPSAPWLSKVSLGLHYPASTMSAKTNRRES